MRILKTEAEADRVGVRAPAAHIAFQVRPNGVIGDQVRTEGNELASGFVPGTPAGKPSVRFSGGRAVMWAVTSDRVKAWKARVDHTLAVTIENLGGVEAWAGSIPRGAALGLSVRFVFPTTDRAKWGADHTGKPDTDNCVKLFQDRAKLLGLFGREDDAAVAGLEAFKVWGETGGAGWTLRLLGAKREGVAGGVKGWAGEDAAWWGSESPR